MSMAQDSLNWINSTTVSNAAKYYSC